MRNKGLRERVCALITLLVLCAAQLGSAETIGIPGERVLLEEDIVSEAAILMEASTGTVLFEKNPDRAMFPASTTKVMTCLLALEYGRLDEVVTIPQEASDVPKDSSLVPVTVGERMSMRDLVYGLMLHSGNDAANAVAAIVGGSVEAFVARMNEKAAALGMTGTHYSNAHGYHADDHYTTARDMAILAREALKDETFRQIVATPGYVLPSTNKRDTALKIVSTNEMLLPNSSYYYEGCIGVKTGFTRAAGQTFIGAAERNGVTLIAVVLKSADNKDDPQRWVDTARMLDFGFSRYTSYTFSQLYSMGPAAVNIAGFAPDDPYNGALTLRAERVTDDFSIPCLDGDTAAAMQNLRDGLRYEISRELAAPVAAGDIIGTVTYTAPDGRVASATLVASRDIAAAPVVTEPETPPFLAGVDWNAARQVLRWGLIALAALIVLSGVLRARRNARRRRRRRERERARPASVRQRGTYRSRDSYYS